MVQNTEEKWDGFYMDEHGVIQNAWTKRCGGFYFGWNACYMDNNGVIQNDPGQTLRDDESAAIESDFVLSGSPIVSSDPLKGFATAVESGWDA